MPNQFFIKHYSLYGFYFLLDMYLCICYKRTACFVPGYYLTKYAKSHRFDNSYGYFPQGLVF
jgi:hypothetical protein